jgi:hypothetical protein
MFTNRLDFIDKLDDYNKILRETNKFFKSNLRIKGSPN